MKDNLSNTINTLENPAEAGIVALVQNESHDLRGTFGIMSGLHSLLPLVTDEAEKGEMFNRLHNNMEYATQLFGDLEDYCAIATGSTGLDLAPLAPGAALEQLKKRMASTLSRRQVELQISGSRDVEVVGDEDKFQRIVRNIVYHLIHSQQVKDISLDWGIGTGHWYVSMKYAGASLPEWLFFPDTSEGARPAKPIGLMLVWKLVSLLGGSLAQQPDTALGEKVIWVQFPG